MVQLAKEVVMKVGYCMCECEGPSSKPGESEEETLTNYSMTPALATHTIASSVRPPVSLSDPAQRSLLLPHHQDVTCDAIKMAPECHLHRQLSARQEQAHIMTTR